MAIAVPSTAATGGGNALPTVLLERTRIHQLGDAAGAAQLQGHAQFLGEDVDTVPHAASPAAASRTGKRARSAPLGLPAPAPRRKLEPISTSTGPPSWPCQRLFPWLPRGPRSHWLYRHARTAADMTSRGVALAGLPGL